jgi:hypothetical protein
MNGKPSGLLMPVEITPYLAGASLERRQGARREHSGDYVTAERRSRRPKAPRPFGEAHLWAISSLFVGYDGPAS